MAAKVNWKELVVAILGAVVVGVSVGLGTGFGARGPWAGPPTSWGHSRAALSARSSWRSTRADRNATEAVPECRSA